MTFFYKSDTKFSFGSSYCFFLMAWQNKIKSESIFTFSSISRLETRNRTTVTKATLKQNKPTRSTNHYPPFCIPSLLLISIFSID